MAAYIIAHDKKIGNPKMRKKHDRRAKTIEDDFYQIGQMLFLGCIIAASISFLWPAAWYQIWIQIQIRIKIPPCLFHLFTGYYCPGCGGTRAVRALLQGHVIQSVYYHPIVPYGAALYLYFMVTQTVERMSRHRIRIGMRYRGSLVWSTVAVILVNFLVRNILHYLYGFHM